jgi:alpha-glucosidase
VAAVVEQGARERKVYLPAGAGWFDFWSGGQEIMLAAPWAYPPLVVKAGAIIPRNVVKQHFNARAEERGFALFPPKRGSFSDEFFENDGLSEGYRESRYGLWAVAMECDPATIAIAIKATGAEPPKDRQHDAALAAAGAAQGNGQERQDHLRSRYRGQPRGSC